MTGHGAAHCGSYTESRVTPPRLVFGKCFGGSYYRHSGRGDPFR